MLTAAQFTIPKTWKQPICLRKEWIKKMWYIYTTHHFSPIKHNEIMPFAAICKNLEIVTLTEVKQRQVSYITYMWSLKKIVQMNLIPKQK